MILSTPLLQEPARPRRGRSAPRLALLALAMASVWLAPASGGESASPAPPSSTQPSPTQSSPTRGTPATQSPSAGGPGPVVLHVAIDSPIHPMAARHLESALDHASGLGAALVVVQIDTPGGSLPATREMSRALLGSPVPTVAWVGPAGARAASAGFFLLLSTDVAAMAPGTHTGAAHPVSGSGEDIEGHMGAKVEQDTLALVRTLADRHGRDRGLAQAAVSDSASYTAAEAVEAGLADLLAATLPELLAQLDGRTVEASPARQQATLELTRARVEPFAMPPHHRLLAAIAHPQIAGLLMALGLLGLYGEISNPGTLVPGTVGAICLILGFFALSVLPFDYAGLALVALALGLFVAETQVPTFGVLTAGGAVALALGLTMMFDDLDPTLRLHPAWAVGIGAVFFAIAAASSAHSVRIRRRRPSTGLEGMVGQRGEIRGAWVATGVADPEAQPGAQRIEGKVFVHGELWSAWIESPGSPSVPEARAVPEEGTAVEVEAVDGLRLRVRALEPPPRDPD